MSRATPKEKAMGAPRYPIDTPAKVKQAREFLGLNKAALARAMRLGKASGRESVRRWETEGNEIYGPVQMGLEKLVSERKAGA